VRLIRSEVDIDAPADAVWRILTDFPAFPEWNPFIERAEGRLEPGERITVHLRIYKRRATVLHPRVTRVVANEELRWEAVTGRRGILDVERIFVIETLGPAAVRFHQSEVCTGALSTVVLATGMERRILAGYERLNAAIKARAENAAA